MVVESNDAIAKSVFSDWLKNLAPVLKSVKSKTKSSRTCKRGFSRALRFFPHFEQATVNCLELGSCANTTSTEARTSSENVTSLFCNHFSIIQSHHAWKCVLTILELNWNQRLGHKKTKLNICHHMLTSSTQLQNRSFHVVERTRTSRKCQKMKNARAKRAKILFFLVKYANLWGFCCRRRHGCLSSL